MSSESSEWAPGEVGKVYPDDNRTYVNPTTVEPYCFVGLLTCQFPDGTHYGTGTLIGPNKVLTCVHNVWKPELGHAQFVRFAAAQDGGTLPRGSVAAFNWSICRWYDATKPTQYDYAVVGLESPPLGAASLVYPQPCVADDATLGNTAVCIAGYPGDLPKGAAQRGTTMWEGTGRIDQEITPELLFHRISTYYGNSGSSLRLAVGDRKRIVGIHVKNNRTRDANCAVRVTQQVMDEIGTWMEDHL